MKDETRIILNTLLAHASRAASMGIAFVMVPYLMRHLGEETYGIIGIAGSILALVTLIEFGARPATVRQYTHFLFGGETRRANVVVSTSMAFYLGLAALIILVLAAFGGAFLETMNVSAEIAPVAYWTLLAAGLALALNLLTTPYRAALVAHLRHDVQHYTEAFTALLRAVIIVAAFSLWAESLLAWGAATVAAALVALFVSWRQSFRVSPTLVVSPALVTREGWKDLASIGTDTTLAQFSSWLNTQSGPVIISYYLGSAAVAHYAPILVIVNLLLSFSFSFFGQLIPVMTKAVAQANYGLVSRSLVRSARYSVLISGAAAGWIGIHAHLLIPAWLGEGFEDTALALSLWCGTVIVRSCAGAALPVFLAMNRLRGIAILGAFSAFASLLLAVYLVGYRDMGIQGVVIAALCGELVRTSVRVVFATRLSGISLIAFARSVYPTTGFCLAAMVGVAFAVQHATDLGSWIELVLSGTASLLAFAVTAWRIGLNADDRSKVASYARGGLARLRGVR